MDSLHAIGFYVSSGVSLAGGLGVALLPSRGQRGVSVGLLGLGLAAIYLTLSAGLAAVVVVVCYLGCAAMFASPQYRRRDTVPGPAWRQVGAIAARAPLPPLPHSAVLGGFLH